MLFKLVYDTCEMGRRIEQIIKNLFNEDEFGFRKEKGTRETSLSLRLIQSVRG